MTTIYSAHKENLEWKSEIEFLKKEIGFFRSIILDYEKKFNDINLIETLVAFGKEFSKMEDKLNKHLVAIEFQEKQLKEKIVEEQAEAESEVRDHWHMRKHITDLSEAMVPLKESLYNFIFDQKHELEDV